MNPSGSEKIKADARMKRARTAYGPISVSFALNAFLFLLKLWASIISGSVAILADAVHTLSDSITTAVVFIGFKVAGKHPDEKHPFGHERAEKIAAIVIGVILLVVAVNFIFISLRRILTADAARFGVAAIWVMAVSLVLKEALARYSINTGRKIKSDSLIGDGWHHRSDALSSALILAGIIAGRHLLWIDGALGIIVALFLSKAAYDIIRKSSSSILGESLSEEIKQQLKNIVKQTATEAGEAHHFHLHSYGSHRELSFHISLPGHISLKEAHETATLLEDAVRKKLGFEPTVHVDHEETISSD